jgi:hypothetical protein
MSAAVGDYLFDKLKLAAERHPKFGTLAYTPRPGRYATEPGVSVPRWDRPEKRATDVREHA